MGKFKGKVGSAEVSGTGQFFPPGFDGEVDVGSAIFKEDTNAGGSCFVIELPIVSQASSGLFWQAKGGPTTSPVRVGDIGSWVVLTRHKPCWGNMKKFTAVCLDMDPGDVSIPDAEWDAALEALVNEDPSACSDSGDPLAVQPCKGTPLHLHTTATKTREGGDFTVHHFSKSSRAT